MISDQKRKQQIQLDIKQLKHLILQTENERVGQLLAGKLAQVKAQLQLLLSNSVKSIQLPFTPIQSKQEFTSIHKFAWEDVQGTRKVKIMINLQGIKKQCQPSQIIPEFTSNSVTLKIHQYKGKNYIFSIPKLYKQITPQKCSFDLTTNYLIIKLQKKQLTQWIDIHFKKDIFKSSQEQERNKKGPMKEQQKLMDMVKKIYQDGDPQMQKAIKEALQSSQEKKRTGKMW